VPAGRPVRQVIKVGCIGVEGKGRVWSLPLAVEGVVKEEALLKTGLCCPLSEDF
jgi:hypothetical protein